MKDNIITQRIATKAVITNSAGKLLILREASTYDEGTNSGKYQFPGGRVDIGESFMEALRREVMEEAGLEVEIGKPLHVGEWFPVIKDVPNQIIGIFFLCTALTDNVTLSEEHDDYAWVDPSEISQYELTGREALVVEEYLKQSA